MFWFLIYLIHFFKNYLGIRFGLIIVFVETLMRSAKLDVFRTFILYRSHLSPMNHDMVSKSILGLQMILQR